MSQFYIIQAVMSSGKYYKMIEEMIERMIEGDEDWAYKVIEAGEEVQKVIGF